jgi:acetoin utilization protein AcuB
MFVRDLMSRNPVTITADINVQDALNLMKAKSIRRLPVLGKDGRIAGIVSEKDLLYASPSPVTSLNVYEVKEMLHLLTVGKVMTREVVTIDQDAPLEDAAVLMATKKISGLPATQGGSLAGIITETDLFKAFLNLLGGTRRGVRMTVLVPGVKGVMAKVSNAIFSCGGDIVGLGLNELDAGGKGRWEVVFKIQGAGKEKLLENVRPVVEDIVDLREL